MNQTQGLTVAMILVEPRKQDVDVSIVTCEGATMGVDGSQLQVRLYGKNKATFDIVIEKETFLETRDAIGCNLGKFPFYEMPSAFDLSLEAGPSRQHGTL